LLAVKNEQNVNFNTHISRHEYSLEHMQLALEINSTPTTLRATGGILRVINSFFKINIKMPSWYTVRLWLLKFGLFKLVQNKQIADDWIWIADHSIQLGSEKCLVILGIRSKDLPKDRALSLEDVEPLAVVPTSISNRDVVCAELNKVALITGVPAAIVSDAGPDLKAGIDDYCKINLYTRNIYDITHWIALQLKNKFERNEVWISFIEYASVAQQFMRQTDVAALAPPNQRSKARYLNVDLLIRWAQKIILLLTSQNQIKSLFNTDQVTRALGWLRYFKDDIHEWGKYLDIVEAAKYTISQKGLYRGLTNDI